jgi:hypothetical protein
VCFSTTAADNALNKYLEASILSRPAFDWVTVSLRYKNLISDFSFLRYLSLRCGQMLVSRLIQLSLLEIGQPQMVLGVPRIFAVWSSLEVIAEQEPQIFNQALMEQIQVRTKNNII